MANTKVKAEQLEAAQTNITSLGTLTALTVDDITIDGSTISDGGDLTIDVAGDINLDADGGDINFKDGGTTYGFAAKYNNDLWLGNAISDGDVTIRGNDGGSSISALTFDMSAAGAATFNAGATFGGGLTVNNAHINIDAGMSFQWDNSHERIEQSDGKIEFFTNNGEQMTLSGSNLGIGTNNPSKKLHVNMGGTLVTGQTYDAMIIQNSDAVQLRIVDAGDGGGNGGHAGLGNDNGNLNIASAGVITFSTALTANEALYGGGAGTGGDERMRITSSGFVGINDTAPPRRLSITGEDGAYSGQTSGNSRTHLLLENNASNYIEFLNPAGSGAGIFFSNQNAQNRGSLQYTSDSLYLTQGGYDRAIIRPDGAFQTSDTNALVDFDSGGNRVRNGSLWGYTLRHEGTGANPHGLLVLYNAASPDSTSSYPIYFTDSSAARFHVNSAGNLWTSDYGYITSDETLKENIVDATPKLADIMKLKVRNFNWKKSYHPNSNEKMLGFIAQEFEEVFPALINEHDIAPKTSAKDDAEHVPNMKKSVVAGALIPALVKAMQEQQTLIETLQTKVAALEAK